MKRVLSHTVVCLLALSLSALAQGPASVSGTVQSSQGEAQIGVLVQLLSPDNVVLASAFTDHAGHYTLQTVTAGNFQVRASAAMFLPVLKKNVPLAIGSHQVLNLTMTTLTEVLQWLPARPKSPTDQSDDWQWTLRSPANRPILREFDPTIVLTASSTDKPGRSLHELHAHTEVASESTTFASSGVHQIVTLDHISFQQHDYLFRANVTPAGSQSAVATVATGVEIAPGHEMRFAADYQWHSGLLAGTTAAPSQIGSGTVRFSQTSQLGPQLQLEAGNELIEADWAGHGTQMHPFADLTYHPSDSTTLTYTLSTVPGFSRAEDTDETIDRTPQLAPSVRGLQMEHGLHQQLSASSETGTTQITAALFRDQVDSPLLQGLATASAFEGLGLPAGYDSASGLLREAAGSFTTQGAVLTMDHQFGTQAGGLDACISLLDSEALTLANGAGLLGGTVQMPATHVQNAQMAELSLKGAIAPLRTHWSAAYGLESHGVLVPMNLFDLDGPQPFLSVSLRQPLHGNNLEAVVEVRNLLAQGYHPFLSPDGETIYFMQLPRSIQGGLVFSF